MSSEPLERISDMKDQNTITETKTEQGNGTISHEIEPTAEPTAEPPTEPPTMLPAEIPAEPPAERGLGNTQGNEKNKTPQKELKEEILKKVTVPGLSGSSNLGNTCYMNASLQLTSATKPLLSYLIDKNSSIKKDIEQSILDKLFSDHEKKNKENNSTEELSISPEEIKTKARQTITYQLRLVLKYMWAHNCEVEPKVFKRTVNKQLPFFNGMRQQDAQEFLTALLDKIHENTKSQAKLITNFSQRQVELEKNIKQIEERLEIARKSKENKSVIQSVINELDTLYKENKDEYFSVRMIMVWKDILSASYSIINDIFSGTFLITTICNTCKKEQHRFERFDIFMLHLPEEVEADKQKYTITDLMKSYVTPETMTGKNTCFCDYCSEKTESVRQHLIYQQPNTLIVMIKKYQKFQGHIIKSNIKIEYDHELDITPYMYSGSKGYKKYELYAVIRHSGGYSGGHYYSYTKNPINDLWYLFDDGDVYNVDPSEALNSNGYVLAYRIKQS